MRSAGRVLAMLVVAAAVLVLGAAALRAGSEPFAGPARAPSSPPTRRALAAHLGGPHRPPAGEAPAQPGRGPGHRLGGGVRARSPRVKDGAIASRLPTATRRRAAGRCLPDADLEGTGLCPRRRSEMHPGDSGCARPGDESARGPAGRRPPRAGAPGRAGRYVALVISGRGAPPVLEWALGSDERGTMSSPTSARKGPTRMEIAIDPKKGELSAFVGEGQDRRLSATPCSSGPTGGASSVRCPGRGGLPRRGRAASPRCSCGSSASCRRSAPGCQSRRAENAPVAQAKRPRPLKPPVTTVKHAAASDHAAGQKPPPPPPNPKSRHRQGKKRNP